MSVQAKLPSSVRLPDDRTVDRLIKASALILAIGIPLFAAFYYFDRHVDSGGTIADRTIAAAEQAVKADPNDLAARDQLAGAYLAAERYPEAVDQFTQVLAADPKNGAALVGRGLAYVKSNQSDLAKGDFQKYVDLNKAAELAGSDPQLALSYFELGTIDLADGENAAALAAFEGALKIDRSDADSLYGYGTASIRNGDATNGVAALRRAVAFVPTGWCDPYRSMVEGYTALKDLHGIAYANGMVAACEGKGDTAKAALQPLLGTSFEPDALVGLAYLAAHQGDNAKAIALFQQVLAKDPTNLNASIGLKTVGAIASPAASGSN